MGSSTTKKVLVRRFDREPLSGFANPQTFEQPEGIELLTPGGELHVVPYQDIKVVCFVRDFDGGGDEEEKKIFTARPKIDGLWVRMKLRDGEVMDGILSNNLLQVTQSGFTVVPPDPYSNNQRLFVPRAALNQIHVLGVVGSPLRQPRKPKAPSKDQISLFE